MMYKGNAEQYSPGTYLEVLSQIKLMALRLHILRLKSRLIRKCKVKIVMRRG